jgi:pSer/pThr/pTyr-binding forkhead associated (FHA) protein
VPYGLEILKHGTLLGSQELNTQAFYTFGRSPTADVLLEHPTASRLHAVLQVWSRRLVLSRPHTDLQATRGLLKASFLLHVDSMLAVQLHL